MSVLVVVWVTGCVFVSVIVVVDTLLTVLVTVEETNSISWQCPRRWCQKGNLLTIHAHDPSDIMAGTSLGYIFTLIHSTYMVSIHVHMSLSKGTYCRPFLITKNAIKDACLLGDHTMYGTHEG